MSTRAPASAAPRPRCGYERHHPPDTLQFALTITYATALNDADSLQPTYHAEIRLLASTLTPPNGQRVFGGQGAHRTRAVHTAITRALHSLFGD